MDNRIKTAETDFISSYMLPWIDQIIEELRDERLVAEPSMGLDEWPGILIYGAEGRDIFFSVKPLETDSGVIAIASMTDNRFSQEGRKKQISFLRIEFPMENPLPGVNEIVRAMRYFERIMTDRLIQDIPVGDISPRGREIIRINGLQDALASINVDAVISQKADEPPELIVEDEGFLLTFSYLLIGPEEDSWLLVAECKRDAEAEESVRFDVPEYGGLQESESYGHMIEAAEALLLKRKG